MEILTKDFVEFIECCAAREAAASRAWGVEWA